MKEQTSSLSGGHVENNENCAGGSSYWILSLLLVAWSVHHACASTRSTSRVFRLHHGRKKNSSPESWKLLYVADSVSSAIQGDQQLDLKLFDELGTEFSNFLAADDVQATTPAADDILRLT